MGQVDAPPSFDTPFTTLEWKVYFEFLIGPEKKPPSEDGTIAKPQNGEQDEDSSQGNKAGQVGQSVSLVPLDQARVGRSDLRSVDVYCGQQVTPSNTSKLKWVFPLRIVPPSDVDPTELFLDHGASRCTVEMHLPMQ